MIDKGRVPPLNYTFTTIQLLFLTSHLNYEPINLCKLQRFFALKVEDFDKSIFHNLFECIDMVWL